MSSVERVVIGPCTLYRGDCLDVLGEVGPVELIVMDPPYFLPATHYSTRTGTARSLTDLGILEYYFAAVFRCVGAALGDKGVAYVFCDGQSYPVFYCTAYPNFRRLRPLIWDKETSINGYGWRHQHEIIVFAERSEAEHVPTGDGDVLRCRAVPIDDREHLAQKPVALLHRLIMKHDATTVCDPFMGSGSTALACLDAGRQFIGIEKEPKYFDIACRRIEQAWRDERSRLPMPVEPVTIQTEMFSD